MGVDRQVPQKVYNALTGAFLCTSVYMHIVPAFAIYIYLHAFYINLLKYCVGRVKYSEWATIP